MAKATVSVRVDNLKPVTDLVEAVAEVRDHAQARDKAEAEGDANFGEMRGVAEMLDEALDEFNEALDNG